MLTTYSSSHLSRVRREVEIPFNFDTLSKFSITSECGVDDIVCGPRFLVLQTIWQVHLTLQVRANTSSCSRVLS